MNLSDRFWAKVDVTHDDDCWSWSAYRDPNGYGRIGSDIRRRTLLAHRVSYAIANGIDPHAMTPDTVIRHTCDNPSCVNPNHLIAGTQADNVADMVARGRKRSHNQFVHGWCKHGHDVTDERNLYFNASGQRRCRTCVIRRASEAHARKKQEQTPATNSGGSTQEKENTP